MGLDRALLDEAARRVQGPDPASARPLIARLLATHPDDPDALTLLGLAAQRTGDADGALAAFARARAGDPRNPARIGNHALMLKAKGRFEEAIAALHEALAIRPDAPVTLANLGACLIAADRAAEAEAPLRAAIAAKPDHGESWNNLGIMLARTGRATEAITAYRRAIERRPDWPEAALNLADALTATGDAAGAGQIAAHVLQCQPANARAANQLAAHAEARGDQAGAIAIYRRALTTAFSHPVAHNLVLALLAYGEAQDALTIARRMTAESPSVTTPLAFTCAALDRLGRQDELDALAAIDRFVHVEQADTAPGFASLAAFHDALAAELAAHPSLTFEPEGLVTRAGRQSDDLATANSPALKALGDLARDALDRRHAALGGDDHVWLRARPDRWSLSLWGTILSPGGAVESHIHAPNWLSGVYYPHVPAAVGAGAEGGFAIGPLPARLGGQGRMLRSISPAPGLMILFPSFLWHMTLPFGGHEDRLSFAFDLVPAGTGRPHRLSGPGPR